MFSHDHVEPEPKTILPETCFVAMLSWEVEGKVKAATGGVAIPPECPEDKLFQALRGEVIHWAHTNKTVCHPGISRILFVIQRFWWPKMVQDVTDYVNSCPVCACNKVSHQKPSSGSLYILLFITSFKSLTLGKGEWEQRRLKASLKCASRTSATFLLSLRGIPRRDSLIPYLARWFLSFG